MDLANPEMTVSIEIREDLNTYIYSEIIKYSSFAQEHMFDFQHKEVGELRRAASLIVEALKDTRDIWR